MPCFEFAGLIEDSIPLYDNKSDCMILLDTEIHGLFILQDHSVVLCSFWSLLRTGHLSPSLVSSLPHIDEGAGCVVEVDTIVVAPDIGAAGYVTSGGSCGYRDRSAGRPRGSGGPGSRSLSYARSIEVTRFISLGGDLSSSQLERQTFFRASYVR